MVRIVSTNEEKEINMAEKLLASDIAEWYRQLNVARQQNGVAIGPMNPPAVNRTSSIAPVNQLVADIITTRNKSEILAVADNTTRAVSVGEKITGKENIEGSMISMLRVCPNINCLTTYVTETKATTYTNSVSFEYFGNGEPGCTTQMADSGFGGACGNGCPNTSWGGYENGGNTAACSRTSHANGAGNNNSYYKDTTYSVRNHYTEEEAKNR